MEAEKPSYSELISKLRELETVDEVVAKMREFKIKGKPRDKCKCALAVFLKDYGDGWPGIRVNTESAYWREDPQCISTPIRFGPVLGEFVKRFDAGEYPDLIGEPSSLLRELVTAQESAAVTQANAFIGK